MERDQYARMRHFEEVDWWFRLKRDFVYGLLQDGLAAEEGGAGPRRVADVGSGTGIVLEQLPIQGLAVGFEFDRGALRMSQERGLTGLVRSSAVDLPGATGAFDAVLALDVLEHLDDDVAAMREIRRILRPGGVAVISVPAHPALWSPHDAVLHHRRRYRREELRTKLTGADLDVEQLSFAFATVLPVACVVRPIRRWLQRLVSAPPSDDFIELPDFVERGLYRLCRWEVPLVLRGRMPVGLSLVARCRASPSHG